MTSSLALETDELLGKAVEATGLDDLGFPTYRDGLERHVDGLNHEAALSPTGAVMAERTILQTLANRLKVESWWSTHPELEQQRVERPSLRHVAQ